MNKQHNIVKDQPPPVVGRRWHTRFQQRSGLAALVVLLLLFVPSGVLAEGTPVNKMLAPEIAEKLPKNPEELLTRLKILWEKPEISGSEFAEKVIGVEIGKWRSFPKIVSKTITPYRLEYYRLLVVDNGDVMDRFDVSPLPLPRSTFCITPKMTKEIFGEPSRMGVKRRLIDSEEYVGYSPYRLYFVYILGSNRALSVSWDGGQNIAIGKNKQLMEDFENHKDFCADAMGAGIIEEKQTKKQ